jgi:hypothetical protein
VSAGELTREIAEAGVGVARLVRYDPRWPDAFDASANGFLRSFLGPILSLPFVVIVSAMITGVPGDGHVIEPRGLWAAGLSQLINMVAFPAVVAALARPLGVGAGYGAFIVVVNWATLFLNVAVTAATALLLLGTYEVFGFVWLTLFGLSLFVIWRASRETLSHEIATSLMVVVLWVGLGVLTDHLGALLVGARSLGG